MSHDPPLIKQLLDLLPEHSIACESRNSVLLAFYVVALLPEGHNRAHLVLITAREEELLHARFLLLLLVLVVLHCFLSAGDFALRISDPLVFLVLVVPHVLLIGDYVTRAHRDVVPHCLSHEFGLKAVESDTESRNGARSIADWHF